MVAFTAASEAVASDPAGNNGTINYTYDAAGNRTQQTSTNPAISTGGFSYDADDRLTTDSYDANGNTVGSGGLTYAFDFENHLIQQGGATIVYDGDGNRVQKTVAGVTTKYLVATVNPTGYPQVVYETFSGTGITEYWRQFVYGLERISQYRQITSATQKSYYVYDGHGSVRALTDQNGNVTDTYDYDAFGNVTHQTGTTPNEFLFAGEQYDTNLHLYYNRARYLNTSTGRFWSMDTFEGDPQSPLSLHKYLYVGAEPVDGIDPSGNQEFDIGSVVGTLGLSATLGGLSGLSYTGTLKGALYGAAGGGTLGFACLSGELCARSAISGVLNVVFQLAANTYSSYYDRTLGLPPPDPLKQREAIVAAFASGAAAPIISEFVPDPDDTARLAALQGAFNAGYGGYLRGESFQQVFSDAVSAFVVAYVVDVGVENDFGPQLYSPKAVDFVVSQVQETISQTISTAINPIQEHILRLFPDLHRFVYGN